MCWRSTIRITETAVAGAIDRCIAGAELVRMVCVHERQRRAARFSSCSSAIQGSARYRGARIAAVGPATRRHCVNLHLQVDLEPEAATARKLAEAFKKIPGHRHVKICLLRAEVANRDLPTALEEMGAIVDDVPIYKTVPETETARAILNACSRWARIWGDLHQRFHGGTFSRTNGSAETDEAIPADEDRVHWPGNEQAIHALKLEPALEAKEHTTEGLVAALAKTA